MITPDRPEYSTRWLLDRNFVPREGRKFSKKVIVKAGEGHGFGKLENNVELYNEIIKFLDMHIGAQSKR